jgi:hypothetical protein
MNHRTNVLIDRAKSELPLLQERADVIMRERRFSALLTSYGKKFNEISISILNNKIKFDESYLLYGITKVSPFMKKINTFVPRWEYWLESVNNCNLCDGFISKTHHTKTCITCNLRTCDFCFRMCVLANDTSC